MGRHSTSWCLFIPLALSAIPALAFGMPLAPAALEAPAAVSVGQTLEIRWSGVPSTAEEIELVLSLDGGRSFHLRVSDRLEGRVETWRWRVPDLPTRSARLMLRMGDRAGEHIVALSPTFEILRGGSVPRPDPGVREVLVCTGFDSCPLGATQGSMLSPDAGRFEDASETLPGSVPGPEPDLVRPPSTCTCVAHSVALPIARHLTPRPTLRSAPLRN
jgi:hypothetical protein